MRLQRSRASSTMAISALAMQLGAEGRDIISLAAGEPHFETPAHIRAEAIRAMQNGETRYTPAGGTLRLKEAIIGKFQRDNGLAYRPEEIIVSSGAKHSCFNVAMTVLDPGDEAIIPAPYWVSYPEMVRLADATPVIAETSMATGFKLTPDALREKISARTRLLYLNSPGNPSGAVYTRGEWQALGEVLAAHPQIIVAADDVYEHICWSKEAFISFATACPELQPRTVTINGVSKAYAMTGWRIGYAAAPVVLAEAMVKLQGHATSGPCSISQAASIAALEGKQDRVAQMTAAYRENHDYLLAALRDIPELRCLPADGAFYAFPDATELIRSRGLDGDGALCELLLREAGVAVVPGSAFGMPGHIRLSCASAADSLREAVDRIHRLLA